MCSIKIKLTNNNKLYSNIILLYIVLIIVRFYFLIYKNLGKFFFHSSFVAFISPPETYSRI